MKTFYTNEDVTQYVEGNENWLKVRSGLYTYIDPSFQTKLSIHINPYEHHYFTVIQKLPNEIKTEKIIYTSDGYDENSMEELERIINFHKKKVKNNTDWHIEKEESKEQFFNQIEEWNLSFNEEKGCYEKPLSNGNTLYFFVLPYDKGIELVVPQDKEETRNESYDYEFTKDDIEELLIDINVEEKKESFLYGWVRPMNNQDTKSFYRPAEFLTGQGNNIGKAREFYNIIVEKIGIDMVCHVLPVSYDEKQGHNDCIDFECNHDRDYLKEVADDVIEMMYEFAEEKSFVKFSEKYSMRTYFQIQLNQMDTQEFETWVDELKSKLDTIINV